MKAFKFKKVSLITTSIVTLFSALAAVAFGWWLNGSYNQPQVEYYSTYSYYKLEGFSIGNVSLSNNGRKTDKNIALILYAEVTPNDINVTSFTSDYQIKNNNGKTIIILNELKPKERADITFKIRTDDETFDLDVISDSGKVNSEFRKEWWCLSFRGLLIAILVSFLFGSILVLSTEHPYRNKRKK